MNDSNKDSLGGIVRRARQNRGATMRRLAQDLRITHPYLSDIENNRRIPSEVVLARMSARLGLDFDTLMQLAGRLGETTEQYIEANRLAGLLFRKIAEYGIDQAGLVKLLEIVEDMHREKKREDAGE